jgi:peptidoglycan/xylan/chitin deacetylase (PgdA/CDA1 family)
VYKKKKKVITKKSSTVFSLLHHLVIPTPYLLLTCIIFYGILYYINFCFLSSNNNISFSAFTPQKALADSGNTLLNKEMFPFKDEGSTLSEITNNDEVITHGPRDKKEVALTFDADMTQIMEYFLRSAKVKTYAGSDIINFLTQNNVKATLFLTGMWMETYPDETRALAENPLFELANHSYSHPSFSGDCYGLPHVPFSDYPSEIKKTQLLLETFTQKKPSYFRFPGGCYDQGSLALVKQQGLKTILWDTVADDGFNTNTDRIIQNVMSEAQNGSIIVMHMGGESNTPKTFAALQVIYKELKDRGYSFVTVSELLQPKSTPQAFDLRKYLLPSMI